MFFSDLVSLHDSHGARPGALGQRRTSAVVRRHVLSVCNQVKRVNRNPLLFHCHRVPLAHMSQVTALIEQLRRDKDARRREREQQQAKQQQQQQQGAGDFSRLYEYALVTNKKKQTKQSTLALLFCFLFSCWVCVCYTNRAVVAAVVGVAVRGQAAPAI